MTAIRFNPSSHLSISRYSLIDSLSGGLPKHEVDDWLVFCEAMSFVVNCSYAGVLEAMRKDAWLEEIMGEEVHHTYIGRLLSLISAAQYSPVTDRYFGFGVYTQNYSSGQQIDVNLDQYEPIFESYFHENQFWFGSGSASELGSSPPEYSSRVLAYYRGTTTIKNEGFHLQAKLKYLVEFWITAVCALGRLLRIPLFSKRLDIDEAVLNEDSGPIGSRFSAKKLERVTMDTYMREHGMLKSFFQTVTLVEPAYSNVIIIYPNKKSGKQAGGNGGDGSARKQDVSGGGGEKKIDPRVIGRGAVGVGMVGCGKSRPEKLHRKIKKDVSKSGKDKKNKQSAKTSAATPVHQNDGDLSPSIQIESYNRVPFKDLGFLMPGKQIQLGYQHKFRFTLELCISVFLIFACFASLRTVKASQTPLILVFLLISLWKAVTVFRSLKGMHEELKNWVEDWLDQRLIGKGAGFVASLAGQVQEQELKEVLLGYFFLWKKSPLTQRQLDYEVETFLNDKFRLEIDFEVEDALQKLVLLKLIEEAGGKFRCAQRPKEYLDDPAPRWLDFYSSFRHDGGSGGGSGSGGSVPAPPSSLRRGSASCKLTQQQQQQPDVSCTRISNDSMSISRSSFVNNNSLTVPKGRFFARHQ